ncbi:STM4012 family radical SAM protein [Actinomadura sp. ATCC 31491]|uniref:Heme chaperone HemW n=1 Tax=Actinomadura luzonensis TaxID=2805427 RepID=A0ABT0GBJ4_9ACTN|nr:STM4012 family radical SAM protein [Actinomadura luzonensis]MCK2221849.1 STM4012 family radical SAM protein [Actinomadura luzonensis]
MRPYEGYVYAYPHKTAYRPLRPRPPLTEVWAGERAGALYVHIPFCEMRCGFCNLFTRTGAPEDLVTAYLDTLERQAVQVRDALDETAFATAAFGGGTPTYLAAGELARLFDLTEKAMGVDLAAIPLSVETSPATATPDRLAVLAERGTTRVSIGVQSFIDAEARSAVRPQRRAEVDAALDAIRASGVPVLNIDLIYGIDGQTVGSWLHSIETALSWRPEEIYLYPLYVRPLTGLGRQGRAWDDQRLELYRAGRDRLVAAGYEQVSMRLFRLPTTATHPTATHPAATHPAATHPTATHPTVTPSLATPSPVIPSPVIPSPVIPSPVIPSPAASAVAAADYCCQTDGMVGLGCGARSYTSALHYSFEYAVEARHVRAIIDDYVGREDFGVANVGFALSLGERKRRHLIQSLLQAGGLSRALYRERFGVDVLDDFPPQHTGAAPGGGPSLEPFAGWLLIDDDTVRLTAEGLAHSDAIGPALFSPQVRRLMDEYAPC